MLIDNYSQNHYMKKFYFLLILTLFIGISYFIYTANRTISGTINIYSARKEQFINELLQNFTKETGIRYNLLIDSAPKLLAKIESEQGNSPADILITSDLISVLKAKNKNLLKPIFINDNNKIDNNLLDSERYWYGLSLRKRLIFFNKQTIDTDLIKNYEDLASAKLAGRLLIRSSNNDYNQALISQLLFRHGYEKTLKILQNIVANFARDPAGGDTDQLKALLRGEGDIAVANYYYYKRLENSDEEIYKNNIKNIFVLYPNQNSYGVNINLSTISMLKSSNKDKAVQKLIEYLLSQKAQQFFVEKNYEESVLKAQQKLNYRRDNEALQNYNNYSELNKLIQESGWK
jgi:iron(III) transport system substrate-binding protein